VCAWPDVGQRISMLLHPLPEKASVRPVGNSSKLGIGAADSAYYAARTGLTRGKEISADISADCSSKRDPVRSPSKAHPSLNIPYSNLQRVDHNFGRKKCASCGRRCGAKFQKGGLVWWRCRKCWSVNERLASVRFTKWNRVSGDIWGGIPTNDSA
jgi:hypothetical protein